MTPRHENQPKGISVTFSLGRSQVRINGEGWRLSGAVKLDWAVIKRPSGQSHRYKVPKDLILREDFSGEKKFGSNKTVSDYRYTGLYLHGGDGAADEIRRYRWRQTVWSDTLDALEDRLMRALMKKKNA